MALKNNIFTSDLDAFLDNLGTLGHYRVLVAWQLEHSKELIQRSIDDLELHGLKNAMLAFSAMSLMNIFGDAKYDIRAPFGHRNTEGDDVITMTNEMERRFNSFLLVSMFEELE